MINFSLNQLIRPVFHVEQPKTSGRARDEWTRFLFKAGAVILHRHCEVVVVASERDQHFAGAAVIYGIHEAVFDANHLPSGVYLYRITAGNPSTSSGQSSGRGFTATRKMLLVR